MNRWHRCVQGLEGIKPFLLYLVGDGGIVDTQMMVADSLASKPSSCASKLPVLYDNQGKDWSDVTSNHGTAMINSHHEVLSNLV